MIRWLSTTEHCQCRHSNGNESKYPHSVLGISYVCANTINSVKNKHLTLIGYLYSTNGQSTSRLRMSTLE